MINEKYIRKMLDEHEANLAECYANKSKSITVDFDFFCELIELAIFEIHKDFNNEQN